MNPEKPRPQEKKMSPEKLKHELLRKSRDVAALKNLVQLSARLKRMGKKPEQYLKKAFKK